MAKPNHRPSCQPRYTLTPEAVRSLLEVEAAKTIVDHTPLSPTVAEELRHRARIRSTHFSTWIEGNRLTLEEVEKAVTGLVTSPHDRERDVTEGIRFAAGKGVKDMTDAPSISELERRMRPGGFSEKGFLGPTESLEALMHQDDRALEALGVSHEQVADALESMLQVVEKQRNKLLDGNFSEYSKREGRGAEHWLPNLYNAKQSPRFSLEDLPSTEVGYLVGNRLQVFIEQYRGLQDCPWGCGHDSRSSLNFLVLNRQTARCLTGPGLAIHLIRAHHFFEGLGSPFRVDPVAAIEVFELVGVPP